MTTPTLPELLVPYAESWREWLAANPDSTGVRLVLTKAGGDVTSLTYAEAIDEALCFGWIDSQASRRDDESYLMRMTPRGPKSPWSARNINNVSRLEQEGRMTEAGRAAVRAAEADGRWSPG